MTKERLISSSRTCIVELKNGVFWIRLALRLSHEFTGGNLVRVDNETLIAIEGMDELSATYNHANWLSGVASGALFAFRALHIPRQQLALSELSGSIRATDIEVVANATAMAIAKLADEELPRLEVEGWTTQTQIIERAKTPAASPSGQMNGGPSSLQQLLADNQPVPEIEKPTEPV